MDLNWKHHADQFRSQIKEHIMEATRQLILEKGITNVTIVDITKEVGISRVTFYKHYQSIHEIALDIQMRILSRIADILFTELEQGPQGEEKLRSFLAAFPRIYETGRDDIRFIAIFDYTYNASFPTLELQEVYKAFILGYGDRLSGAMPQQESLQLTFLTALQSIWGLMQRLVIAKTFSDTDSLQQEVQMVDTLTSILLQSLVVR
ncbi:TetR/AcrR family transcriptional regulator [Ectobacillus ponti]|uniref:TetR/AcrR family transcriptional regulator n=1 Tax=Ectobacillus ponti TaxID=2961894 RepID=A0AA41X9D6_9BACI|nr:TetR/AcrR family transcriptional regulator [Ectobacillus ponti]MCP8967786.1 TetR/AcrR family transcriptional regulator [Ectobacillus ponti]